MPSFYIRVDSNDQNIPSRELQLEIEYLDWLGVQ